MKLLFKVEGGQTFGMGRVTRSLELAREIRLTQAVDIGFQVNDDPVSVAQIRAAGFVPEIAPLNPEGFAILVARQAFHGIIFDQETEIAPLTRSLRSGSVALVALDCFDMENDALHLIVNLLNHSPRGRPISETVRYVEGLDYAIIRSEFDAYIGQKKRVAEHPSNLLVSFGGADPSGNTLRVLQAMKLAGKRDLRVDVTLGRNFADTGRLEDVASGLPVRVSFHSEPPSFAALMYACDVAITGGGTTLLEAAALSTPVLVIAQTIPEVRFSRVLENGGAAVSLGLGSELNGDAICRYLFGLLDDRSRRETMSAAGGRLVDGRGRRRLAAMILDQTSGVRGWAGSTA